VEDYVVVEVRAAVEADFDAGVRVPDTAAEVAGVVEVADGGDTDTDGDAVGVGTEGVDRKRFGVDDGAIKPVLPVTGVVLPAVCGTAEGDGDGAVDGGGAVDEGGVADGRGVTMPTR
jgi:hypothetical protein